MNNKPSPPRPSEASEVELDQVRHLVQPGTLLALLTITILLAVAILWSFLGNVSTKVSGQGILIRSGTLFPIMTVSAGQLLSMEVEEGQEVDRGTIVAKLDQPAIKYELRETQSLLEKLNEEQALLQEYEKRNDVLTAAHTDKQRKTLEESIKRGTSFIHNMNELVQSLETLHRQGIVSSLELEKQKGELSKAHIQRLQDQQNLAGLEVSQQKNAQEMNHLLVELTKQIIPVRERVMSLQERLKDSSEIRSLHRGTIVEIHKNPGTMLQQGESVATLEMTSSERGDVAQEPLVVAYVAPFQGLEIQPGMQVQVVPESVREEEYGVMLGEILTVSPYPVSPKGIMRVVDNQDLAKVLTRDGAPVMIKVRLHKDKMTASGYRWSSGKGPNMIVKSGAQCFVRVIARNRAPIELIIPELKRRLFGIMEKRGGE